jgi:hypothetical protein
VEKTIFLGPPATTIPSESPDLDDLGLERLSPQNAVVRTQLNASFPTAEAPDGSDSWFFLENLTPGQRYEVRICWLATVWYLFPSFRSFSNFNSILIIIAIAIVIATTI